MLQTSFLYAFRLISGFSTRYQKRSNKQWMNALFIAVFVFSQVTGFALAKPIASNADRVVDSSALFSPSASGAVDSTKSQVLITDSGVLKADGVDAASIQVTLKDTNSQPVSGVKVVIEVVGDNTQLVYDNQTDVSNASGQVSAQLRSTAMGPKSIQTGYVTASGLARFQRVYSVVFHGAEISGVVYYDANQNGVKETTEPGLPGIPLQLSTGQNAPLGSTLSGPQGEYAFDGLQAGNYQVVSLPGNGYSTSNPSRNVSLSAFQASSGADFGVFGLATVNGKVWEDLNKDGTPDANEPGLANLSVNAGAGYTTTTNASGNYQLQLPVPQNAGPANFDFEKSGQPIEQGLNAQIYNGDFEKPIPAVSSDLDNAAIYGFETPGYELPESTYPQNYNFEMPVPVIPESNYPENYNFETGSLGPWTSTGSFSVVADSHSGLYAAYKPSGGVGSVTSPAFTVPAGAEALSFEWKSNATSGTSVVLLNAGGSTLYSNSTTMGTSGIWQKYYIDLRPFVGQSIRFGLSNGDPSQYVYLDDIKLEALVPAWTVSYGTTGTAPVHIEQPLDWNSKAFAKPIGTDPFYLTSPAFTVPVGAEALSFEWKSNATSGTSVVLLNAAGSTLYSNSTTMGTSGTWQKYYIDVRSFVGQSIRFGLSNGDPSQYIYLDNLKFEALVPGWTVNYGTTGTAPVHIEQPADRNSKAFAKPIGTDPFYLRSPAFTVPVGVDSLSFEWKSNATSGTSIVLLSAGGPALYSSPTTIGTGGIWQKYYIDVRSFVGQSIQFGLSNGNPGQYVYLDNLKFETLVPGWTVSYGTTGTTPIHIEQPADWNSMAFAKPMGTDPFYLTSPAFTVPAGAEVLSFEWKSNGTTGTSVALLSASGSISYSSPSIGTSGIWKKYYLDVRPFVGQTVRFGLSNGYSGQYVYLDNLKFEALVPGWTVSSDTYGATPVHIEQPAGRTSLALISTGGPYIKSSAFTVPAGAENLSWEWKSTGATGTYFYLLDANGSSLSSIMSNAGTSGLWQTASLDIRPYVGQTVRFQFFNVSSSQIVYLDNVSITPQTTTSYTISETNLPGYNSSTLDQVTQLLSLGQQVTVNFGDYLEPTATPSPTATATETNTATPTPSATYTPTPTVTWTPTAKATETNTATPMPSMTHTPTPTVTWTPTATATETNTATQTPSATHTPTQTATWTSTATATPSRTATRTPSATNTPTKTATFTPSATNTPTSIPSEDIPVPGDYNGDGVAEKAIYRTSTSTWYIEGQAPIVYGNYKDKPAPADYDGDGDTDISVFRPSNGNWYVRGCTACTVTGFGQAGDLPVPANYNSGTGAEMAVFRPSNGTWHVEGQLDVVWGNQYTIPLPRDYNGDGLDEIAFYRTYDGLWSIRGMPSSNINFGTAADKPVPADYDGDGKVDRAIFQNGLWRIYYAANNIVNITYGGQNDSPAPAQYLKAPRPAQLAFYRSWNTTFYVRNVGMYQFPANPDMPATKE